MREQLVAPYDAALLHGDRWTIDGTTFRNWNPYVNEAMTLPTALAASCDTYFYQLGLEFYRLPPEYGSPLQKWASAFGFGKATGLDVGGEETGLLPTPEWRRKTYTKKRYPQTGDRQAVEVRRLGPARDRPEGPARHAAPDGALLRADRERREARHAAPRVQRRAAAGTPARSKAVFSPAPQDVNVDPAELNVIADGLYKATHA